MTKNKLLLYVLINILVVILTINCKKSQNTNRDCGCGSYKTVQSLVNTPGSLFFMNNQYQQSWFVVVDFPNNGKWLCKICNIEKVQGVINTISTSDTISVKFTGKLNEFCPNETIGITSGTVVAYHIKLDSLKRN